MNNINNLVKQYILWPELQNDFQKNIYFADTKVSDFRAEILNLLEDKTYIENHIAVFYVHNQRLSEARKSSQDVLSLKDLKHYEAYQATLNELSKKILSYILVSATVEARHCYTLQHLSHRFDNYLDQLPSGSYPEFNSSSSHRIDNIIENISGHPLGKAYIANIYKPYAQYFISEIEFDKFKSFFIKISSDINPYFASFSRNSGYKSIVTKFYDKLEDYSILEISDYLKIIFNHDDFAHSYGGPAWAGIVDHAIQFMKGNINAEMFVDQAFSLEHNSGTMFNKDFLFKSTSKVEYDFTSVSNLLESPIYLNLSALILNAQHTANVLPIFSLSRIYDILHKSNIETIHNELSYGQLKQFDTTKTLNYLETIYHISEEILNELNPITSELKDIYPELFIDSNEFLDIKKIFNSAAQHFNPHSNHYEGFLSLTQEDGGFFDFWNHLHNTIYKPNLNNNQNSQPSLNFSFNLYDLAHLPIEAFDKNIIGGKAWSLANMNQLQLPVPKAQVFSTDCCDAYYKDRKHFNHVLSKHLPLLSDYLTNEEQNPILCSIRSGAAISMPGMMDTVLNVGIDDSNYHYFCETMGQKVIDKCVNKFMELFCSSRLEQKVHFDGTLMQTLPKFTNILTEYNFNHPNNSIDFNIQQKFPLDQEAQIKESIIAVFESWNSPRAIAYRNEKGISHDLGTAAIVQQMVFGNLNEKSCTGVVFSRDCLTGENKLVGEFLPKAQGEDVVSGSVTPFSIEQFKQFDLKSYNELEFISKQLEKATGQIQDIEFTVEDGKLYILQHRQAICSPIAALEILKDKTMHSDSLLNQITPKLLQPSFTVVTKEKAFANGLSANSGVIQGMIIKSEADMLIYQDDFSKQKTKNPDFGWIFYAELTSPEHMPLMNKTQAFITEQGGFTSHAAIIARSLNKPCIVGLGGDKAERFIEGQIVTIDATNGKIWDNQQPLQNTNQLAKAAVKILISNKNVDIKDINVKEFYESIQNINSHNRSWIFNLPNAVHIHKKPIKREKFLNIGQKVAMILAADHKQQIQLKYQSINL